MEMVYVYVLNSEGQPLMPTSRRGKVRRLLKSKKAKVVRKCPFTIQLLYKIKTEYTKPITLGVDAGSKHIGVSASTERKELYSSIVNLRDDIVKNISTRRELRRCRRNRKTRYRKPKFNNRIKSKQKGWIAPSIRVKIENHLKEIEDVFKILPISNIIVEVANFDTQLLKAQIEGTSLPQGIDYQQGEQLGFWNVREYVLFRDGHKCQCCKGSSKDNRLNVHHIESRKTGGDAPNNLITLCETCHIGYHNGSVALPEKIKRGMKFKDATFMGIMRWTFYNRLKEIYPNVSLTYGYITKNTRIKNNLPKSHNIDALCIAQHPKATLLSYYFQKKKVRNHNRQIHKMAISKGGKRQLNQAPYIVKGFRLFDKVKYKNKECFVSGRRSAGYFALVDINWNSIYKSAKFSDLKLIEPRKSTLVSMVNR